jgi:hypothetical protein
MQCLAPIGQEAPTTNVRVQRTAMFGAVLAALTWAIALPVRAGIIPADRLTVWAPGIPGGIPARATTCAMVNASTYGNGSIDASSGIQDAVDACPAGQVVLLSAGNFTVNNLVLINKGITLRGAGGGVTILTKKNGARARTSPMEPVDPGTYAYDAQPVIVVGPSRWPKIDLTSQNLVADGAKGSNSVAVPDASGFVPGEFVLLDELSGASWQSTPTNFPDNGNTNPAVPVKVWRGDKVAWNMHLPVQIYQDDNGASNAAGPYDTTPGVLPDAMSWFARTDRPINEVKEIASISGNTITFTSPLHIDYRTAHAAQVTGYSGSNALVRGAGVENLSVYGGADGQVRFENAAYSWAKGIENTQWIGEGFAANGSFRIEIRDSYIHDGSWPEPGGAGYAISFAAGTAEVLVENNIVINACKVMVARSSGAGSVFGYNYTDDSWDFDTPTWVEVGLNASHMAGPHHVLFEGNYSPNADSDYTHGNAIDLTFFRNWLTGQRRSFTDGSNIRTVGLAYGSWWDSFVGNVLGRTGQMIGWNYSDPAMSCDASGSNCTGNNGNWSDSDIWKLGYDPERWTMNPDPLTLSTVIRDGNFDFLTNTVHWHNTPAGFTLPNSLYLASKPPFFGSDTWPWVDPIGATKVYILPAKARYDAGTPFASPPGGAAAPVALSAASRKAHGTAGTFDLPLP